MTNTQSIRPSFNTQEITFDERKSSSNEGKAVCGSSGLFNFGQVTRFDVFDIQFASASGRRHFYSGQKVQAQLVIHTAQPVTINALVVLLTCETHTGWVNKTSDVIYETNHTHWQERIDLSSQLSSLTERTSPNVLPAGSHNIPFTFTIPPGLPSSVYSEMFGWTRYSVLAEACLGKNHGTTILGNAHTVRVEATFEAHSVVGIDLEPLKKPSEISDQVEHSTCCTTTGHIYAHLRLPYTGYLPGERLCARITIRNTTRKNIQHTPHLSLCQQLHFKSQNRYEPQLHDVKELVSCLEMVEVLHASAKEGTAVRKFHHHEITQVELTIPSHIPPTSAAPVGYVTVTYYLKLDMAQFDLILPIVIGTVRQ